MSRTHGSYFMDTAMPDGKIYISPLDVTNFGGGTATATLNAKGDIYQAVAASQTINFILPLSKFIERLGVNFVSQEQFGTAAGVAGPTSVANTGDPADVAGYPPFTGTTYLTPRTGYIAKGLQINNISIFMDILAVDLTTHSIGLSKTVFAVPGTPAAPVVTDVLAVGNNGLTKTHNAAAQTQTVILSTPAFNVTDLSALILAYNVTTPAGGTYKFRGMNIHVSFNFN